jgi:hypothetical protein
MGSFLAAAHAALDVRVLIIGLIVAAVVALIVFLAVHLIAPAYERLAAGVAFLIVFLLYLLDALG